LLINLRDTAHRQLSNVQRVAASTLPQPTTTNVDGEEVETFIDQSSTSITESV
jgi:ubiquinone biosynthesis protein UbiJ